MLQTDVAANTRCHPLPLAVSCCLATSTTRLSLLPTTIPKVTTFGIHKGGKARVDVSELSRVAMERCKTARCAIGLMGSLAEEYGYYGADETEGEGGESLQIVDTQEAWVFHILADDSGESAVWAAQRVRDGHIAAVANQFIIRELDLDNEDMFMASSNVEEVATRLGFYDSATDGKFDFTKAYAMDRKHLSTYATRRVWRVMTMAAPSSELPGDTTTFADDYPFDIKPDKLLTVKDVVAMHRDHYEGTPYDMTKGLAGGPYGDPSRFDPSGTIASAVYPPEDQISDTEAWAATPIPFGIFCFDPRAHTLITRPPRSPPPPSSDSPTLPPHPHHHLAHPSERAISIYRCSYSWVSESRAHVPNELGVVWFSQYAPHASGAVPLYVSAPDIPKGFSSGSLLEFDLSVSYWAHAAVGNWADRFYVHTIGDIKTLQSGEFPARACLCVPVQMPPPSQDSPCRHFFADAPRSIQSSRRGSTLHRLASRRPRKRCSWLVKRQRCRPCWVTTAPRHRPRRLKHGVACCGR